MAKLVVSRLSTLLLAFSVSASSFAQEIAGEQFSCAELEAKVKAAGSLVITARDFNPHGSETETTNTFVSDDSQCQFIDDEATEWDIYAKDGEVCRNLFICFEKPPRR